MKIIALLLAAALGLPALSGCVTPPKRTEPLAGINIMKRPQASIIAPARIPPAFKNLSVALILSQDSQGAIAYLEEFNKRLFRQNYWPSAKVDTAKLFFNFTELLSKHFKSVEQAENLEGAAALKPDLVVVLDVYAKIAPPPNSKTTKLDAKLVFLSPDGAQLDAFGAATQAAILHDRTGTGIETAAAEARDQLEITMAGSAKLRELSRSRPNAPAPAVAAVHAAAAVSAPPRSYASTIDRPNYRFPENSKNFAIVIGVEDYENLPPAEFAGRDAAAVRDHLLALGYPQRNVVHLTGSKASRTGIEKYLESWLPRNVGEDSQVFVYFSGHGAPDVGSGQAYLVPWDGDSKFLENTGYPVKRLYAKLNTLKARRVIVAMDSCFSGAGGRSVLAKGARPLVTKMDVGNDDVRRLVVFAASGSDEITATDEAQGHGLFTYQFLTALNDKKGEATVKSLYDALLPRVQDAARRDNRDQTPQLLPADLGDRAGLKFR